MTSQRWSAGDTSNQEPESKQQSNNKRGRDEKENTHTPMRKARNNYVHVGGRMLMSGWFSFCECSGWADEEFGVEKLFCLEVFFSVGCSRHTLSVIYGSQVYSGLKAVLGFVVFIPLWSPDLLSRPSLFFITPGTTKICFYQDSQKCWIGYCSIIDTHYYSFC